MIPTLKSNILNADLIDDKRAAAAALRFFKSVVKSSAAFPAFGDLTTGATFGRDCLIRLPELPAPINRTAESIIKKLLTFCNDRAQIYNKILEKEGFFKW